MTGQQLLVVLLATITQFIIGAIWYTPLFGKLWGEIHGFDKLDKKTQQKMMSQMGPIFGVQILATVLTSIALVVLQSSFPDYSLYMLTSLIWLGFIVPAHISGILFSSLESKWILPKSLIMAGGSLAGLMSGAATVILLLK